MKMPKTCSPLNHALNILIVPILQNAPDAPQSLNPEPIGWLLVQNSHGAEMRV